MMETNQQVAARPARRVRLIEHGGDVVAYPEPHRTPVLPTGWAPLTRDQQVLSCAPARAAPTASSSNSDRSGNPAEYRVYRLATDQWGGLSVVCKVVAVREVYGHRAAPFRQPMPCDAQLLGLAVEPLAGLRIATNFFNWDLEAHGQSWRLGIHDSEG